MSTEEDNTNNPTPDQEENLSDSDEQHLQDEDSALEEEFAALLDEHLPGAEPARGEVQELAVVAVREDYVLVDIGGKAEATIPKSEFPLVDGELAIKAGDLIKVVQIGRKGDGTPRLSYRKAREREAQAAIKESMDSHQPVKGVIRDTVKGGVMVDIGIDAFMPASQVDLFKIPDLASLVGQEIEAYILEFDPRRNRAVLSRRELLVERREKEKVSFLSELHVDSIIVGKVKSCMDFGIFVDLGTVDGFIPREEVSWDRGKSPGEVLKPGEEVELKILNVDSESGKITLSRKRLQENPWDDIETKFPEGRPIRGKVVSVESYGAFIQLAEGLTGMIHASDMSWASGNKKPEDYVRLGDEVTAQVIEVNKDKKRISLGLKQLSEDPWKEAETRFTTNSRHKGTVTSLTNYGAFVKLTDHIEGMVHVSDMSWEKRVNHPKEIVAVGDEVEVIVLKADTKKRRLSLGIKQLKESPYDAFLTANPVNSLVEGKVTRFAPFGAFVELAESLEGLIHISQIDSKRVELPENALELGSTVRVKIIGADKKNQKISLSRKEAMRQVEKDQIKTYMKKQDDSPGGMSFGEALRAAKGKDKD